MKPGDRVRIARGEHEGRVGTIVDPQEHIDRVRSALLQSPTRDALERRLQVPDGCHRVKLHSLRPGGPGEALDVFSEGCLIPIPVEELASGPSESASIVPARASEPVRISVPQFGPITDADVRREFGLSNPPEPEPAAKRIPLMDYLNMLEREASIRVTKMLRLHNGNNVEVEIPILSAAATLALVNKLREFIAVTAPAIAGHGSADSWTELAAMVLQNINDRRQDLLWIEVPR